MGIVFALIASFLWAVSSILVSKATERASPIRVSFVSLVPSPLVLLVATLATGQERALLSLQPLHWLLFGLAGFFTFVLGRTFSFAAIRHVGASRASALGASNVLFGPLSAILLLREVVDLRTGLGIGAIFLGILLVTLERR